MLDPSQLLLQYVPVIYTPRKSITEPHALFGKVSSICILMQVCQLPRNSQVYIQTRVLEINDWKRVSKQCEAGCSLTHLYNAMQLQELANHLCTRIVYCVLDKLITTIYIFRNLFFKIPSILPVVTLFLQHTYSIEECHYALTILIMYVCVWTVLWKRFSCFDTSTKISTSAIKQGLIYYYSYTMWQASY